MTSQQQQPSSSLSSSIPLQPPPPPDDSILSLLIALTNPHNPTDHQNALSTISTLPSNPQSYSLFLQQLSRVLSTTNPPPNSTIPSETWTNSIRPTGGLLLKNTLKKHSRHHFPEEIKSELRSGLLRGIIDPIPSVRNAASSCISSVITIRSSPLAEGWYDDLFSFLTDCLTSEARDSPAAAIGALSTFRKIIEDSPADWDIERSAAAMVVPLLGVLTNDAAIVNGPNGPSHDTERLSETLKCLTTLIGPMPSALSSHMDVVLSLLSSLTGCQSTGVLKLVSRAITTILSLRTEFLREHFASVCEWILSSTGHADESVALEATEFWLAFAGLEDESCTTQMMGSVQGLLPRLVPLLLRNTVYKSDKIAEMMVEMEEERAAAIPKEATNNVPVFHRSKDRGGQRGGRGADEEDGFMDDQEGSSEWTLRKCSAASIDSLSSLYGPECILPPLLPALQEGLSHQDLWVREASILVLGAIAEGCQMEMQDHLSQLHPFLLNQLKEDLPPLRAISCWTLSRYADYVVYLDEPPPGGAHFKILIESLLHSVLDRHHKVQLAACSALGVLVEAASVSDIEPNPVLPFLGQIYPLLIQALYIYQHHRSRMILFDTIGVLADFVGSSTGGSHVDVYLPPLIAIWTQSDKLDRRLLPLMETMASICLAVGPQIQNFALNIFDLALGTIESCLLFIQSSTAEGDDITEDDSDFIVASTDVLDGMVEGLGGSSFVSLVSSSKYAGPFLNVLVGLCQNDVPGVRMSIFALVGDITRHCPQLLEPAIGDILKQLIRCLDPMHASVCNNAIWALGEIALRCVGNEEVVKPYAEEIVRGLLPFLCGNGRQGGGVYGGMSVVGIPGLCENAAACLGRLAKVNANFVANELEVLLGGWCEGLARISDLTERHDGFSGLIYCIYANPNVIIQNPSATIPSLVFAIVSWHIPPNDEGVPLVTNEMLNGSQYSFVPIPEDFGDIGTAMEGLLGEIRKGMGEEGWEGVKKRMPVNVRRLLRDVYRV